jgi:hypothetical protein
MATYHTNIQITNGMIVCTPKDGHLRARQESVLEWASKDEEFTLSFVRLGGASAWPFKEPQPATFPPSTYFKGTLSVVNEDPPPAYKYTVRIGSKLLDPIIIVDK